MDDDGDFGAFGRGFDDDFQPINGSYENLINYIQSRGAHSAIMQMQAADDASGAGGGVSARTGDLGRSPQASVGGGESGGFDGSSKIPPLGPPGLQSAAGLENSISQKPVNFQDAASSDGGRYHANGAGSTVATGPTLDDAARSAPFGMKDADLTAAWRQATAPLYIEQGIRHALPSLITSALPQPWKSIATLPAKFVDQLLDENEPQRREDAYRAELFRKMNDTMSQSATSQNTPPATRGFFMK